MCIKLFRPAVCMQCIRRLGRAQLDRSAALWPTQPRSARSPSTPVWKSPVLAGLKFPISGATATARIRTANASHIPAWPRSRRHVAKTNDPVDICLDSHFSAEMTSWPAGPEASCAPPGKADQLVGFRKLAEREVCEFNT